MVSKENDSSQAAPSTTESTTGLRDDSRPSPSANVEDGPATTEQPNQPSKKALKKAAKDAAKAKAKADKALNQTTEQLAAVHITGKKPKVKGGANYNIGLRDADLGVVTRFPPEPSGYLHIGHAKAALLNDYFAHEQYQGTLLCRFDDTNPAKEKEEYTQAIIEDLSLMGIKPDRTSFTSNYFQELYEYCIRLISDGKAYADDTPQEIMGIERRNRQSSKRRDEPVEKNLARFEEMKSGSEEGQRWSIRARLAFDSLNGAMRDPVIYRCNVKDSHARTGTTWKIYPTYDFACPIIDSLEGVTHALRTIEYRDRNPQYEWFLDALNLRKVHIWDFARMNFVRTLLSKRKLRALIEMGSVSGWDDPRFPTIRGIMRRGMTVPALREFMLQQGPSKNIVNMDWTVFWATNRKFIDPVAPRHTAINKGNAVKCVVRKDGLEISLYSENKPRHPKNPDVGEKQVWYSQSIWIEQEDALSFSDDEEVTLMNWGNAFIRSRKKSPSGDILEMEIELHLQGDFKLTKKKITWLSDDQVLVPITLVDFDFLLTADKMEEDEDEKDNDRWRQFLTPKTEFKVDAFADCNVATLKEGDIIQFERKGYFRCDKPPSQGQPAVFFNIPTGKTEKPKQGQ